MSGGFKLIVQLTDEDLDILRLDNLNDPMSVTKKLVRDTKSMDTLMVSSDGGEIKCHKVFLTVHSPVFLSMFTTEMAEGLTNKFTLVDMTEAGLHALLAYLYTLELAAASRNPSIAMELLFAGDKYRIKRLLTHVRELILAKKQSWFTVSSALKLLQFARKQVENCGNARFYQRLQNRATCVLETKSTVELRECKQYQDLICDQNTAMDYSLFMHSRNKKDSESASSDSESSASDSENFDSGSEMSDSESDFEST